MTIVALGLNHSTAPVAVRERLAFPPQDLPRALRQLTTCQGVEEAAILSTCNRTDLYYRHGDGDAGEVLRWLGRYHHVDPEAIQAHFYTHRAEQAVRHLMRVASGLDSMVLGEPQILGQVKLAYSAAHASGALGAVLGRLFQQSFAAAKRVRTDTAIGSSPVSVAFAAVSLAKQIFEAFPERTALLVGAGETIELVARHLHGNELGRIIIANRTVEKAHWLASEVSGYAIALDEIPEHLAEADIVIASTGSPSALISRAQVEQAIESRKRRPMLLIDIAVPQDIEPTVSELPDIYHYGIDDLQGIIEEGRRSRREAAVEAEEIISAEVMSFMGWLGTRRIADTIRDVRGQAAATRTEVLRRAQRMLAAGDDPAHALEYLADTLTNKLLHAPTAEIRSAGAQGRTEVVAAARTLFHLDRQPDKKQSSPPPRPPRR